MKPKAQKHNPFALQSAIESIFKMQRESVRDDNADMGDDFVADEMMALESRQCQLISVLADEFAVNDLLVSAAEDYTEDHGDDNEGIRLTVFVGTPKRKKQIGVLHLPILVGYDQTCERISAMAKQQGIAIKRCHFAGWGCTESWARRDTRGYAPYEAGALITPENNKTK